MIVGAPSFADPWRFQSNPEVYLLVVCLIGAFIYMIRVVGPHAVAGTNQPVITRRQLWYFVGAMVLMFTASTWPIHQIGEEYLYSVHMVQHMMLSYFMPPLILLATPEWLLRLLIGRGTGYRVFKFLCNPIVAGVAFNGMVMISHIPGVVNASIRNGPLHYLVHFLIVVTALWMWMPVCGPFKEFHLGPMGKMIYLFAQGVVPTVPAGWLVFAEGAVYRQYEQPVRVWGLSVTDDQQLAGVIMKIGGGMFMWILVVIIFITRTGPNSTGQGSYRRSGRMPDAEITGNDSNPLTYEQVTEAFAASDRWAKPNTVGRQRSGGTIPNEKRGPQPPG